MNEGLFRKKSMEKISSPEQLDEYIKVSNPSVWMLLFCIIILLLGICVWGIFGRFDTTLATSVISRYYGRNDCSDWKNEISDNNGIV